MDGEEDMEEENVVMDKIVNRIADLNEKDKKILHDLVSMVILIHLNAFPKKLPVFVIDSEKLGELPENDLIAYAEKEDSYVIFPYYPRRKIIELKKNSFFRVWEDGIITELSEASSKMLGGEKEQGELLRRVFNSKGKAIHEFTLEEILVGVAAHEVRHRVQKHLPIILFSAEEILNLRVDSYEAYKFRALAGVIFTLIVEDSALSEDKKREEFDAALIGHLSIKKWKALKKLEEISKISRLVRMGFDGCIEMGD